MAYFANGDATLFYTDQAAPGLETSNTIILIHGFTCDSHDWSWQIPQLLKGGYRVVALDLRGHGRSSAPSSASFTMQQLADDAAALLDFLGIQKTLVAGHSMGTCVASALCVQRPDLVTGLLLIDPVYIGAKDALEPVVEAMRKSPYECAARRFEENFYTTDSQPWVKMWHLRRLLGTPDYVIAGCFDNLYGGRPECLGNLEVSREYLKQRKAPRFAVYRAEHMTFLERELPMGELDEVHVMSGAGHWMHQTKSEEFNELMFAWLEKVEARVRQ